jgi:5-methylcytosine-specific restriction endonuclease McrA
MPRNTNPFEIKPLYIPGITSEKKKKRKSLTPAQRMYIWENPKMYGRTCSICHQKITKYSDLQLDHTKAFSKGGTKLALAHSVCNRLKSSGGLAEIQKKLGHKVTKRKPIKKKPTKLKAKNPYDFGKIDFPKIKF